MASSRTIDLLGKKFNKWTVLEKLEVRKGNRYWLCRCDCGIKSKVGGSYLRTGKSKQCTNCSRKTNIRKAWKKRKSSPKVKTLPNGTNDPIYQCWIAIKGRCYNSKNESFKDYGKRNIKMCERWLKSYHNFKNDMGERPKGFSIERLDNNGNYEPENCIWADRKKQSNNRRTTKKYEYKSKIKSIQEWSEYLKIPIGKFYYYVHSYSFEWTMNNLEYIKKSRQGVYKYKDTKSGDKYSSALIFSSQCNELKKDQYCFCF